MSWSQKMRIPRETCWQNYSDKSMCFRKRSQGGKQRTKCFESVSVERMLAKHDLRYGRLVLVCLGQSTDQVKHSRLSQT